MGFSHYRMWVPSCHISQEFEFSWFVIVSCAVASLFGILLLKETYAPVICLRRAAKAQLEDPEKVMKANPHLLQERGSKLHMLWINLSRPIIILSHSFICFILSLYMALWVPLYPHSRVSFINYSDSMYGLWFWNEISCDQLRWPRMQEFSTSCLLPLPVRLLTTYPFR